MNNISPVLVFVYNRIDTLKCTIDSLLACELSNQTDLIIYSDGPKHDSDKHLVDQVRQYLRTISGFKSIKIIEKVNNSGLANSIILGVDTVINETGRIIVLEDDLLLSPNFLVYMNKALDYYENNPLVYSISGFMFDIKPLKSYSYDVFFTKRHCSWGWAIWKDRWEKIDWDVKDFDEFVSSPHKMQEFNRIGADLTKSLIRQQKGEINSWAIRCNYHQFKEQTYTVYPLKSKVVNLGFGADATHTTQRFNKYKATLDDRQSAEFKFPERVFDEPTLLKRFTRKYSFMVSSYYYVLNKIF